MGFRTFISAFGDGYSARVVSLIAFSRVIR